MTKRTRSVEHQASNEHTTPRTTHGKRHRAVFIGGIILGALLAAAPAQAQTPVVEAKSADETTVFQVNEDGGLLGLGVFDTGVILVEGPGTRLMWYPAKAAFRAGGVDQGGAFADGSEWNDANVGTHSVAFGRNTRASGDRSTALGGGTQATGDFATALGASALASGAVSVAMGFRSTASGLHALATGSNTTASGDGATTMGSQTTASGLRSVAMGFGSEASGLRSVAMGQSTTASGENATAMGFFTTAQAYASLVIGRNNVIAGNPNGWSSPDPLFVAGNGTGNASRSNALTLLKNGDLTIAGDLTESSDRRLKTGITPLGDVLAALGGIQPVRYRFKDDANRPTGPQLGLIAQEVERAFPELVTRGADGYLSVAYPKLTAVLLGGLQEQQTQIETLEARLAAVEQSAVEQRGPSHALASMASPAGAAALLALLVLGGLALWRRRTSPMCSALPMALLVMATGMATLVVGSAQAQTVTVQNGATLHVTGGGVLDLHGSTLDLGNTGETAQLVETGGGRVTGGLLTATRPLSAASGAASGVDVAGLGLVFSADQALDAVTVTRGHDVQFGGQSQSVQRYYDLAPVPNGFQPESFDLTLRYADAELGPLPEGELELFYSTDEGGTWQRRGFDNRDGAANTVTLEGIASLSAAEGRWTLGASSQPLPVELTAFEAALDGGEAVQLTWTTASETNNAGFHIERARGVSADGPTSDDPSSEDTEDVAASDDAVAWQAVGFVEGAGTTSAARSYRFRDAALPFGAGGLRYRLRQVDLDGTTSFGPEVEVRLDAPERVALHAPYPNPLAHRATVRYELPQAGRVRLAVYNALGQRMAVLADEKQPAGRKEIGLEARRWPSGMYFVRLEVGGAAYTRKLTVVR